MSKKKKGGVNMVQTSTQRINEADVGVTDFSKAVNDNYNLVDMVDSSIDVAVVNNPNDNISNRYNLYDNMSNDSVISAALEMYADDSLTVTPDNEYFSLSQKVEDSDNAAAVNEARQFLNELNIGKHLWSIYYQLAKYGECYLELFYSRKTIGEINNNTTLDKYLRELDDSHKVAETIVMEPYCEIVSRPDKIKDVVYRGSTLYYDVSKDDLRENFDRKDQKQPSHKYIHFVLGSEDSANVERLQISISKNQSANTNLGMSTEDKKVYGYVLRGRSILYDVEKSYRNLSLVENVAMMSKLTRASITRVANVEVGGMSKADTRKAIQRVKSKVKNKVSINENSGSSNYVDVTGMDNIIVNPTMEGKGSLDIETLDLTDPDIKSVLDLDYFANKLFGGLKIPKAYLGFESDLNDSGGETLSQLSIRYSRSVNKIQSAVEEGLSNLCYLYLITKGRGEYGANNIKVTIQPPVTKEEQDKLENMSSKLDAIDKIVQALPEDDKLRSDASIILLKDLGNSSLTKLLIDYQHNKIDSLTENEDEETDTFSEQDEPSSLEKKSSPLEKPEPKQSEEQPDLDEFFAENRNNDTEQ